MSRAMIFGALWGLWDSLLKKLGIEENECQRCGRQLDPNGFCSKCDLIPLL